MKLVDLFIDSVIYWSILPEEYSLMSKYVGFSIINGAWGGYLCNKDTYCWVKAIKQYIWCGKCVHSLTILHVYSFGCLPNKYYI